MSGVHFRGRPALPWLALGLGFGLSCAESPPTEPGRSLLLEATRGPLVIRHILSGTLVAEEAVALVAPDVGINPLELRWLAPLGSAVKKGDRVIELDNSSLVLRLEDLERQVVQAETSLDAAVSTAVAGVAEAQFDLLQKETALTKARILAAVPEDLYSELEYAKLQLDVQKGKLESAESRRREDARRKTGGAEIEIARLSLLRARRELETVQSKLERLEILAPSDGVVVHGRNFFEDRTFEIGDSVSPQNTIVRLPNLTTLYVRAQLSDVDDGNIETGLLATVELDAVPNTAIRGRVREIDSIAQQTSRLSLRRTFGVAIDLEGTEGLPLLPGMSARVIVERRIEKASDGEQPILVPRSTLNLSKTPPELLLASGELRQVTLGLCSSTHCIIEDGARAGDLLATFRREAEL